MYQLLTPYIIHWDEYWDRLRPGSVPVLTHQLGVEVYKANGNGLPLIIEGKYTVMDNGRLVLNCLMHTKALATFHVGRDTINALTQMLEESFKVEKAMFRIKMIATPLKDILPDIPGMRPDACFEKAYQIKAHAVSVGLLEN
jgi:hypothetical protein